MHDFAPRAAAGALAFAGIATVLLAAAGDAAAMPPQWLARALGAAMLVAAFVDRWRAPAIGASVLGKLSLLLAAWPGLQAPTRLAAEAVLLGALLAAGLLLAQAQRREARWDRGQSLRLEA